MQPIRGENGTTIELSGLIETATVAEGSKSEHTGPILTTASGEHYRVYVIGDNPFANDGIQAWIGKTVRVSGTWRNGVVRIEPDAIAETPDHEEAPVFNAADTEVGEE